MAASVGLALLLAACSHVEQPAAPEKSEAAAPAELPVIPMSGNAEAPAQTVSTYAAQLQVLQALSQDNDSAAAQFLANNPPGAMSERVRVSWLKSLGKRGNWVVFNQQYPLLSVEAQDQELRCYAALSGANRDIGAVLAPVLESRDKTSSACNRLSAQAGSQLGSDALIRRARIAFANGQTSDANMLLAPLSQSNPDVFAKELQLAQLISPGKRKQGNLEAAIQASGSLNPQAAGFAYGFAGQAQALNQNFAAALYDFNLADPAQLNDEQWAWYARSALRLGRWDELGRIIRAMPANLKNTPDWQYWLARSEAAQGRADAARSLYEQAAASGRNFYALLATEALGRRVNVRNNTADASAADIQAVARNPHVARATVLFQAAQAAGDRQMRSAAQAEWRYAMRGFNEPALLAASAYALSIGFNEMAIYSADKTNRLLNFQLRYLAPYRDLVTRYSRQNGIDPAWAYGIMRQESRFMIGARSRVGANGLMQIMPATAQHIIRKTGIDPAFAATMEGNIQMGTWYLADTRNNLGSETLASAGYNAGPNRARRWQDTRPLEGAIYAETIPIDETRDYVKKVMANTTYYANLFNEPQKSLSARLGTIPARY